MRSIDLSLTFTQDMPVFPGDDPVRMKMTHSIHENDYTNFQVQTGMHVGTHMDGPLHMIPNGKKLDSFPIDHFIGSGHLIDVRGKDIIDIDSLENIRTEMGDVLLFFSGHSRLFGQPAYYENYPILTEALAQEIVARGIKYIGLDFPSPDRHPHNVHKILLAQDVLIVENLTNLDQLLRVAGFECIALPVKFAAEASLARVIARVE